MAKNGTVKLTDMWNTNEKGELVVKDEMFISEELDCIVKNSVYNESKKTITKSKKAIKLEDMFGSDYHIEHLRRHPILPYQEVEKQFMLITFLIIIQIIWIKFQNIMIEKIHSVLRVEMY